MPRQDSPQPPRPRHLMRAITAAVMAAAMLSVGAAADAQVASALACRELDPGPTHTVTRILDGETVVLDDGRELRLIGVLAPRAIDVNAEADAWPIATAVTEALRALVLGKSIELRFDGERTDRYGRLQAHAF